ncbi:MAG: hypothetical protein J7M25_14570 [Deltaproteobacteria bacterium]|nr:hypothetical protein [Deltaproteobacteria bacterium]
MRNRRLWTSVLVAAAGLLLAVTACNKKKAASDEKKTKEAVAQPPALPCPATYRKVPADKQAAAFRCECKPAGVKGAVWGDGIYTADSSICRAALHAGAITAKGGIVTVRRAKGCRFYLSSSKNGIMTHAWGPFKTSFFFDGKGNGTCAEAKPNGPCPLKYAYLPATAQKPGAEWTCQCLRGSLFGLSWGVDLYTTDSSICKAAVHAGAIPKTGGKVTVVAAAGCDYYPGAMRNGVRSMPWGKFRTSFFIKGKGDGKCKVLKQGEACPARFKDVPKAGPKTKWTCTCDAAAARFGTVYGSGTYTADSSICRAALHAGLLKKGKAKVTVVGAPGCPKYVGSVVNNISSRSWKSYSLSFYFKGKGKGKCPK